MATSTKSYCGRYKRKKKHSKEEFFLGESSDEEPPTKRFKRETECLIEPLGSPEKNVAKDQDSPKSTSLTEVSKPEVYTPTKLVVESPPSLPLSKSLCDLQSPDSAYYSGAEKSPFSRLPSSVGSGFGTDCFDIWAQTGTDKEPRKDSADHINTDRVIDFLHENFSYLKEEMDPDGLADHLFEAGIIKTLSSEKIREEKHRFSKCDILIKAIAHYRDIRKPSTEKVLVRIFELEKCSHLLKNLGKGRSVPLLGQFRGFKIKSLLRIYQKELEDIEPRRIIDDLVTLRMLTLDEHEDILETSPRSERVQLMMKYVLEDLETNFPKFCYSIEKEYPDLGKRLQQKDYLKSPSGETEPKVKIEAKVKLAPPTGHTVKDVTEETLHVKFNIPDERDLEQMVVDEWKADSSQPLEEQAMEEGYVVGDVQFSSIKILLTKLSQMSQLRFYTKCVQSPQFLEQWVQSLMTQEHLKKIKDRGISTLDLEIHIQKPSSVECFCQLTKKCIVTHFSYIEKTLNRVDDIIKEFGNFSQFSEETRKSFDDQREKKDGLVESFLRKLLDMEEIAICLFQRELIKTNQTDLLMDIIKTTTPKREQYKVSLTSFKKGFSLLMEEIEPRKFIGILQKLANNESVSELVMSEEGRRCRCRAFLDFIWSNGQTAVDLFVQTLETENKSHLLKMLSTFEKKNNGNEGPQLEKSKDAVIQNFSKIVDEVDAHYLREVFIERKVIKARRFDSLCKHPSRRTRTTNLLKYILTRETDMLTCFMYALEMKGYDKLVADILKERDSYKPCPRLEMGDGDVVVFKGTCQLKISTEPVKESPIQLELHRQIYGSIDKDYYTRKWVIDHPKKRSVDSIDGFSVDEFEWLAKRSFMDTDASSTNGSVCRRYDEALDHNSQVSQGTISPHSSLPSSPSTSLGVYEAISPPSSPLNETVQVFVVGHDYQTALSIKEAGEKNSSITNFSDFAGPSGVSHGYQESNRAVQ